MLSHYRAFTYDVMAAIVVFQNKETVAILEYEAIFPGVKLYFYAKTVFCFFVNQYDRWSETSIMHFKNGNVSSIQNSVKRNNGITWRRQQACVSMIYQLSLFFLTVCYILLGADLVLYTSDSDQNNLGLRGGK